MAKIIDFKKAVKKKKLNDNASKAKQLFDKKADIYTDNGEYHIRKNRVYICGSNYYGKVYTITSNRYNKNNLHIIKHIYPTDDLEKLEDLSKTSKKKKKKDNGIYFRFLCTNFKNGRVGAFKSREKLPDGTERSIIVIEKYDDVSEYVCSFGNIKKIKSDILDTDEKRKFINKNNIKKLILKPEKDKDKDNKKKAA